MFHSNTPAETIVEVMTMMTEIGNSHLYELHAAATSELNRRRAELFGRLEVAAENVAYIRERALNGVDNAYTTMRDLEHREERVSDICAELKSLGTSWRDIVRHETVGLFIGKRRATDEHHGVEYRFDVKRYEKRIDVLVDGKVVKSVK